MEHSEKMDIIRSVYQYLLRITGIILILIGAYAGITQLLTLFAPEAARYYGGSSSGPYAARQWISAATFLILGIPLLVLPGRTWCCRKSCSREQHTK
ncbi:hypothetical protein HYV74_04235 [Candidatus Uhrbacteria bacterium]|nr:hypothetical protein [Candidatus Uhrbacteria bacterium]